MKARNRPRRGNDRLRRNLMRGFIWFVLAAFILTSVGVALVTFSTQ